MLFIERLPFATGGFAIAPTGSVRWPRCTNLFKTVFIINAHIPAGESPSERLAKDA